MVVSIMEGLSPPVFILDEFSILQIPKLVVLTSSGLVFVVSVIPPNDRAI